MVTQILSIILIFALIISISYVVHKRKKAGITGVKSALTPVFLYLMAITNLLALWFNLPGLLTWTISVAFLLLGAYFTKYLPVPKSESSA